MVATVSLEEVAWLPEMVLLMTVSGAPLLSMPPEFRAELREIVEPSKLQELAKPLLALEKLHKMNEWQYLLMRLFFLDQWLALFKLELPR